MHQFAHNTFARIALRGQTCLESDCTTDFGGFTFLCVRPEKTWHANVVQGLSPTIVCSLRRHGFIMFSLAYGLDIVNIGIDE